MQSLTSRVFYYLVKRQLRKLAARSGSLEQVRAARDKSSARMFKVPAGVAVSPAQLGGLPGEWLRPQGASAASVVLYLHGGAYITGSCHTHRGLAGHLARAADRDCFLLDYRLAPEHPFPAAVDDALAAYLPDMLAVYAVAEYGGEVRPDVVAKAMEGRQAFARTYGARGRNSTDAPIGVPQAAG